MQEETQPRANALFSHIASREHQMIIMDPDKIIFSGRARRRGREFLIDALVCLPVIGIEVAARRHVVEKGPDDLISETGIELCYFFIRELNRLERIGAAA